MKCALLIYGVALCASLAAIPALADASEPTDLFSTDRSKVIAYLRSHRVPTPKPPAPPSGPGPRSETGGGEEEVARAAQVFMKGNAEMRLVVVQALDSFYEQGARMWDACGPDDYEARHYLVWGLADADSGKRAVQARKWLFEEAHASYAAPILRALCNSTYLMKDLTAAEEDEALVLLRDLYRQTGQMTCITAIPESADYCGDSGPTAKYVVRALRRLQSPEAHRQLPQWINDDGKKVEATTRDEMWSTLGYFARTLNQRELQRMASSRALAEAWLLSDSPAETDLRARADPGRGRSLLTGGYSGDKGIAEAFRKNLIDQLTNPDSSVSAAAVRYTVQNSKNAWLAEGLRKLKLADRDKRRLRQLLQKEFSVRGQPGDDREAAEAKQHQKSILDILGSPDSSSAASKAEEKTKDDAVEGGKRSE